MKHTLISKIIHYSPCLLLTAAIFNMFGCEGEVNCCRYYYDKDTEMNKLCEADGQFTRIMTGSPSDKDTCEPTDTKEYTEKLANALHNCCDPLFDANDSSLNHLTYIGNYCSRMNNRCSLPQAIHSVGELCVRFIMNNYECQVERFEEDYNKTVNDCEAEVATIQDEKQRSDLFEGCLYSKFNSIHRKD